MESAKGLKGPALLSGDHRHELVENAEASSEVRFRKEADVDLSEAINLARCHVPWKFCYCNDRAVARSCSRSASV